MPANRLTRRDWFRLNKPTEKKTLGKAEPAVEPSEMKNIARPPNHHGMDLSLLPPMREASLSTEQIEMLFSDIQLLASDVVLMQRATTAANSKPSSIDSATRLEAAKQMLLAGTIQRLQIRYSWQESFWIDTLEAKSDGYRLVRIAHSLPRGKRTV